MSALSKTYADFFPLFTDSSKKTRQRGKAYRVYYMGIDAEWHEEFGRNVVLSYQIATLSASSYQNIIRYMPKGKRLSLPEIVELGIRSVHDGKLPSVPPGEKVNVILVAHNLAAEWSVLADRDAEYITKRLTLIRRSPVTGIHAIQHLLDRRLSLRIMLFDTMLLAPATHQSLQKLSGLLGKDDHKVPIKQVEIENMHLFLRDKPEEYRKYALKDSEACLKLFLLLQGHLNRLVFGMEEGTDAAGKRFLKKREDYRPQKIFRTLASAGVMSLEENLRLSPSAEFFRSYVDRLEKDQRTEDKPKIRKYFEEYRASFRKPGFREHMPLVKRSYLGGRNESYFVGDTEKFDLSKDRLWIDIDFNSCYPTAMALYPLIDTTGRVRQTAPGYRITGKQVMAMEREHIPSRYVEEAKAALDQSEEEFLAYIGKKGAKRHGKRILELARRIDNRLINRWQRIASGEERIGGLCPEEFLIPGFAKVRFEFPDSTRFPCLPVKHPTFGLIFPLEGETTVSASEILLALELGAEIEAFYSVEFPVVKGEDGKPVMLFAPHLSTLVQERNHRKRMIKDKGLPEEERLAAAVMEKLLKEFSNGLYGKTAQAINDRNVFKPDRRTMVPLGPSSITEPVVASLTTSLARAALSASLAAVERCNKALPKDRQLVTVSATTDGFLVGVPKPETIDTRNDYYQLDDRGNLELKKGVDTGLETLLTDLGYAPLLEGMLSFLPVRQMRQGRKVLLGTESNDAGNFLEVKHLADRIVSVKTRGQIGLLDDGSVPLLAKFGHKPPLSELLEKEEYKKVMEAGGSTRNTVDAEWIMNELEKIEKGDGKIETYNFYTLTSFRSMIDSDGKQDMVGRKSKRKFNADFDWKRKLPSDSPITTPYRSTNEMVSFRSQMEGERRRGQVARTDKVHNRVAVKGRTTRFRGGMLTTLTRLFLRGVLQGHIETGRQLPTYPAMAESLNTLWRTGSVNDVERKAWTVDDLKNAKMQSRSPFEAGILPRTIPSIRLLAGLCEKFAVDYDHAAGLLFASREYEEQRLSLITQVVRSVLLAPSQHIEPFRTFYLEGRLPTRADLKKIFSPQVTDDTLRRCSEGVFERATLPAFERPRLKSLYEQIGISPTHAEACARILAPSVNREKSPRVPRPRKNCLTAFVQALAQPDIYGHSLRGKDVINKLAGFGLTEGRYYAARQRKFTAKGLADTPENQRMIRAMAKRLNLTPEPFLRELIND